MMYIPHPSTINTIPYTETIDSSYLGILDPWGIYSTWTLWISKGPALSSNSASSGPSAGRSEVMLGVSERQPVDAYIYMYICVYMYLAIYVLYIYICRQSHIFRR